MGNSDLTVAELQAREQSHAVQDLDSEAVVERFAPLVNRIAGDIFRRLRIDVAFDDLVSYGFTGLLEAHQRFDPNHNTAFSSFAYYRIRGAILDGCRREGWIRRTRVSDDPELAIVDGMQVLNEHLRSQYETLESSPRSPSFNSAVDRLTQTVGCSTMVLVLHHARFEEVVADASLPQDELVDRRRKKNRLREAIDSLEELEQRIVIDYHFRDITMGEIAEHVGYSKSWVCRIHARAINRLRIAYLQGNKA